MEKVYIYHRAGLKSIQQEGSAPNLFVAGDPSHGIVLILCNHSKLDVLHSLCSRFLLRSNSWNVWLYKEDVIDGTFFVSVLISKRVMQSFPKIKPSEKDGCLTPQETRHNGSSCPKHSKSLSSLHEEHVARLNEIYPCDVFGMKGLK